MHYFYILYIILALIKLSSFDFFFFFHEKDDAVMLDKRWLKDTYVSVLFHDDNQR